MFVKCNPSVPTVNIIPVKVTKIPKVYDIIIDLIKEIINLFEDLIMQKISTDHVSINYPQEKLNLY